MAGFSTPVDIANRALQHVGATRITAFTDDSKNAAAVSFVYDKARRAELRRNCWTFATRRTMLRPVDTTSLTFVPAAWDATKTYLPGSVVSFGGLIYHAGTFVGLNLQPDLNSPTWTLYFGTMMIVPWQAPGPPLNGPSTWFAGDLVYILSGTTATTYISTISGNADVPNVVPAFDPTITYSKGDTVTQASVVYQSTADLNLNQTPTGAAPWIVVPATQTDQMMGQNWLKLGASTYASLQINYPIGSGPASQEATRNVFILPNGHLRKAPQDPKAGSTQWLGAPTGLAQTDWVEENGYIVSRENQVIPYRFIADMAEVNRFDDMFCEGLGCRIGMEIAEELTQSQAKISTIARVYSTIMGEARIINGIEVGAVESPEDAYITCRA